MSSDPRSAFSRPLLVAAKITVFLAVKPTISISTIKTYAKILLKPDRDQFSSRLPQISAENNGKPPDHLNVSADADTETKRKLTCSCCQPMTYLSISIQRMCFPSGFMSEKCVRQKCVVMVCKSLKYRIAGIFRGDFISRIRPDKGIEIFGGFNFRVLNLSKYILSRAGVYGIYLTGKNT